MESKKIYGGLSGFTFSVYSDFVNSTFVSGTTLYGQINAQYIGTGLTTPNNVTNTEVSYLTGLTGNVQLQIDFKADKTQTYITHDVSNNLTNYKKIVPGINVTSSTVGNYVSFSYNPIIEEYNVSIIEDSPSSDDNIITNYNPTNWDGTLPNKATEIRLNPTNLIVIQNLLGNTNGRICRLRNISRYPIILQNNVTSNGGFLFRNSCDYILRPNKSIMFTCISLNWVEFGDIKYYGFDYIDTFKSVFSDYTTTTPAPNFFFPKKSSHFIFSAHTSLVSTQTYACYYQNNIRLLNVRFGAPVSGPNLKFYTLGQFNRKNILNDSGHTVVMQTKLVQPVIGTLPGIGMPVVVNGFTNFDLSYGYQTSTNNYSTRLPNFSGGVFFIGVSGYNYSAVTQYNDNTSTVFDTGFNYLSSLTLGVCVLTKSGNSNLESIFYIKNNTTSTYTVFDKQTFNSEILNSYPNLSIFSNNLTTTQSTNASNASGYIPLKYIAISKD